jgi:hypothetical protein
VSIFQGFSCCTRSFLTKSENVICTCRWSQQTHSSDCLHLISRFDQTLPVILLEGRGEGGNDGERAFSPFCLMRTICERHKFCLASRQKAHSTFQSFPLNMLHHNHHKIYFLNLSRVLIKSIKEFLCSISTDFFDLPIAYPRKVLLARIGEHGRVSSTI